MHVHISYQTLSEAMANRKLIFYYLLDLLPPLIVTSFLVLVTLVIGVFLFYEDWRSKREKEKKGSGCTGDCDCPSDSKCSCRCELQRLPWYLEVAKVLRSRYAWVLKLFFSYTWSQRNKYMDKNKKEGKKENDSSKICGEKKTEGSKSGEESNEEGSKNSKAKNEKGSKNSEEINKDKDLDLDGINYENTWIIVGFGLAAALCFGSAFITFWDFFVVKSQQDNCVHGINCYAFVGRGWQVLYDLPLNCTEEEFSGNENATGVIFCYNLEMDIVMGFSAGGGSLFSSGVVFLIQVAIMVRNIELSKNTCCNRILYHFIAIVLTIGQLWQTLIPLQNWQLFFIAEVSKSLQVFIYITFHLLATNIPWYAIKKNENEGKKEEKEENNKYCEN